MKAPDKVFFPNDINLLTRLSLVIKQKGDVCYIRADLAELTWEDIKKIELLLFAIECSSTHPYKGEDLYKEVLRRFLESKKEIKL